MTEKQITYSIETGKLQLSFWDKIKHYGIVFYILLIPSMLIVLHLNAYFFGTPKPLREGEIWILIIPLILGFLFFLVQKNRLKFKSIGTNLSREELNKIIGKVANELEWVKTTSNDKVYIAKTNPTFFSGSWGEQITILFDQNKILINSICRLDKRPSVVSMGRNRQNVKTLMDEIKESSS